jgi:hypothetical protein
MSNLSTTAILGTLKLRLLLTGGSPCSEVAFYYYNCYWASKMVVFVCRWSLFRGVC